jgi:hypothetical protein
MKELKLYQWYDDEDEDDWGDGLEDEW